MNKLGFIFAILGFISVDFLSAQVNTDADFKRVVYDKAYTGGLVFHSRGYALNGRYLKYKDGYNLNGLEFGLVKLRHPKEVTSSSELDGSTRGFVLGRINSFYTARLGFVQKRVLFDKTDQGTVAISWIRSGGLSLGLLKPIYLEVEIQDEDFRLATVRYNGSTPPADIRGEANYFVGLNELELRPGIYLKTGFDFDIQLLDEKIFTLETGVVYDYFFTEIPIFYEEDEDVNWSGFFQFYVSVNIGVKKN